MGMSDVYCNCARCPLDAGIVHKRYGTGIEYPRRRADAACGGNRVVHRDAPDGSGSSLLADLAYANQFKAVLSLVSNKVKIQGCDHMQCAGFNDTAESVPEICDNRSQYSRRWPIQSKPNDSCEPLHLSISARQR